MNLLKTPIIKKLIIPELLTQASQLSTYGKIKISTNQLVYLDISDDYIHSLFPLLNIPKIKKPNYFLDNDSIGAHISIIYPEESIFMNEEDIDTLHHFTIRGIFKTKIYSKLYSGLLVDSFSLQELRKKYGLPTKLSFKGYSMGFHITIGVRENFNLK